MSLFSYSFIVRWADVDANRHLRHSAYSDYAAQARVMALEEMGLSFQEMGKAGFGPILFREETIYKKEVPISDQIQVNCSLMKARRDASRWSIQHQIIRSDGELAAEIHVEGAWFDLKTRRLATLPQNIIDKFLELPKLEGFIWEEKSN